MLDSQLSDLLHAVGTCARLLVRSHEPARVMPWVLRTIGASVHADRALLMPVQGSGAAAKDYSFSVAHEWTPADGKALALRTGLGPAPTPFVGPGYDFTRRLELLQSGRPVVYSGVRALPANETALAQKYGTRSSVRVPIRVGGELMAMLGIDHTRSVWPWRPDELAVLWLAGEILAHAMTAFVPIESRSGPPRFSGATPAVVSWARGAARLFETQDRDRALDDLLESLDELLGSVR